MTEKTTNNKTKFNVDIELGGSITQISFDAKDKSDVIEQVWALHGISTPIIEIRAEVDDGADNK